MFASLCRIILSETTIHHSHLVLFTANIPAPLGKNMFTEGPAPYQRGPPTDYLMAITNKREMEEVGLPCCTVSVA